MIPNAETPPKLNLTGGSLRITGSALKWCLNNKWMNCIHPTRATMSTQLIQSPSSHIKPLEDSYHHQVVTWTLKQTRWIITTDKLITTEILQFLIQDQLVQFLIITDVLPEFIWGFMDQIVGRLDQLLPKDWPTKHFSRGYPNELIFSLVYFVNRFGLPLDKMGCGYIFTSLILFYFESVLSKPNFN